MEINFSNKKILVTGYAWFIGSNLSEALLKKDNKVVCLDNFVIGKRENIAEFLEDPNFKKLIKRLWILQLWVLGMLDSFQEPVFLKM